MGADLIVNFVSIKRGKKINWKRGLKTISRLKNLWYKELKKNPEFVPDEDVFGEGKIDIERAIEILKSDLIDLKAGVLQNRRDMTMISVGPYNIFISGGQTWGDDPTDLFSSLHRLYAFKIPKSMGFMS